MGVLFTIPRFNRRLLRSCFPVLLAALVLTTALSDGAFRANAHEEEEVSWLVSTYVSADLEFTPDPSAGQWESARMITVEGLDEVPVSVMSVHNETHVLFLLQREVNASSDRVGVLIAFEGAGVNGSDAVWAWVGGQSVTIPTDPNVESNAALTAGQFVVVFGRAFTSDVGVSLNVGIPYDDFFKVASWSDGSSLSTIDLENLKHMGLELLPKLDVYPKSPFVYSAVLLVAAFGFIWLESKRYGD